MNHPSGRLTHAGAQRAALLPGIPTAPSANKLTRDLRVAISAAYGRQSHIYRANVIIARTSQRTVRSNPNGTADLMGCICGIPFALEIKADGDRQSENQRNFQAAHELAGGVYLIVRDVDVAMAEIARALAERGVDVATPEASV